jgi:L-fuconolactonase
MTTIDSHQHYWQLKRFDYGWITPDNVACNQDRMPPDLWPQMQAASIERAVFVHAANTPDEIPWMLSLADEYPYIAGVVGSLNLAVPYELQRLAGFVHEPRFKGVRIQVPTLPAQEGALAEAMALLAPRRLACDLLIGAGALPEVARMAKAHPNVTYVLDHLACQPVSADGAPAFAAAIRPFAPLPNTVMKLSGYLTASARGGVPRDAVAAVLRSYVDAGLEVFGADRLLFGSDWPVCTMAGTYAEAVGALRTVTASLSAAEQAGIWGGTAARVYHLENG